jgi:hypothetical protein
LQPGDGGVDVIDGKGRLEAAEVLSRQGSAAGVLEPGDSWGWGA